MHALPLPDGVHSVNPYLVVESPDELIEFLTHAFDGRTVHAEVRIGHSLVTIGRARNSKATPGSREDVSPEDLARRHEAEFRRRASAAR
ncbi:MAG: hypothetical protein ACLQPV_01825 [Vulcanimicrobiaceae bacterium]